MLEPQAPLFHLRIGPEHLSTGDLKSRHSDSNVTVCTAHALLLIFDGSVEIDLKELGGRGVSCRNV